MNDREFWLAFRSALLLMVDAIERKFDLPRTAELKKHLEALKKDAAKQ
jgi:hypothetical protein